MKNFLEKNYEEIRELEDQKDIDKYFEDQTTYKLAKQKFEIIDNFNEEFSFLNNSYPSEVFFEGKIYPSIFNAYQASRTVNDFFRKLLQKTQTPEKIYEIAVQITDPIDWNTKRLLIMEKLIRDKFIRNSYLKQELLNTLNRDLLNTFSIKTESNVFWGVFKNEGENHLGKILMRVREDIRKNEDFVKWLRLTFNIGDNLCHTVKYKINIFNDNLFSSVNLLQEKSYYIIGSDSDCDLVIPNPGVEKKLLVFFFDLKQGITFIDITNTNFSEVDNIRLTSFLPVVIEKLIFNLNLGEVVKLEFFVNLEDLQFSLLNKKNENTEKIKILSENKKLIYKKDKKIQKYFKNPSLSRRTVLVKNFFNNLELIIKNLFDLKNNLVEIILPYNTIIESYNSYIFLVFTSQKYVKRILKDSKKYKEKGLEDLEKINRNNKSAFKKNAEKNCKKSIFVSRIKNFDFFEIFSFFSQFGIITKISLDYDSKKNKELFVFIEFFSDIFVKNCVDYFEKKDLNNFEIKALTSFY
jgi:predicted NAD-dependent protein-ADP-ribosyltransferase YbiA (DUF1768 family)